MTQNRNSQRGVVRLASSLLLAAFGALVSLVGCTSDDGSGERTASVAEPLMCGTVTCDSGPDDCNIYSCKGVLGTCLAEKPQKLPGEACKTPGKLLPGHCALDQKQNFICCAGCIVEEGRDVWVCRTPLEQSIKECGAGGAECAGCQQDCADATDCQAGKCVFKPSADDVGCANDTGVCFNGVCCAGCFDAAGNCQTGTAPGACGQAVVGDKHPICQSCIDTDVCTSDICKEGQCVHGNSTDGTPCMDADKCDGTDSCQGGVCKGQPGFTCPADGNACHAPICGANGCSQQLLSDTDCPNANLCDGVEKCKNGVCNVPGTPVNCDDKNPCTSDDCDPKTGKCLNTPVAATESCENANVCDGFGFCDGKGACVVEPPAACDNPDPCKVFKCDPLKGCVVSSFTTADCNDGNPCTTVDKCDGAGVCKGSAPQKCDDGNECTKDACDPKIGCTTTKEPDGGVCDDGNVCSTGDKCVNGACKSTGGTTCPDDTNPCTVASCDPANGNACGQTNDNTAKCQTDKCHQFTQCSNGTCPVGAPIDCADTNPCTKDDCDQATGCTHDPDLNATCSDNDLCTEGDACNGGKCVATPVVCEAVDDCHKVGTCNPQSSFCDAPRADVGTACNQDTGTCNDKGKCIPNPVTGEGGAAGAGGADGAGGEPVIGTGGTGTGGTQVAEGGKPTTVGMGGEGNEPVTGGDTSTAGGGKGGVAAGGKVGTNTEGGDAEVPEHVFVRDPGGCACSVPASPGSNGLFGLAGLALAAALLRRRQAAGSRSFYRNL